MSRSTSIEWTEATWNPTVGCDRISPGCANCYAKTLHDRRHTASRAGHAVAAQYAQPFEQLQLLASRLDVPLRRRQPTMYFVNSISDLFHENVPDTFLDRVFAVMALAPQHIFQILTKRAERMRAYVQSREYPNVAVHMMAILQNADSPHPTPDAGWPLPNVWLGVSVENQRFANERIPLLLSTPAAVRFISYEPALGPVDLYLREDGTRANEYRGGHRLDWVICGGESGPGARAFDLAWARYIVRQCKAAGVPVFVKQLGANAVCRNDEREELWPGCTVPIDDDYEPRYQGETAPLVFRDRKGGDMAEWPEDLRVRQFPPAIGGPA